MAIKQIIKRDGSVAIFDQSKITEAIWKAVQAIGGDDSKLAEKISNQVITVLEVFFKKEDTIPNVEQIQDLVEKILIEGGHAKTAKAYILYRQKQTESREMQKEILNGNTTKLALSMNSLRVFAGRYLMHDEHGKVIETPEERFERIASTLAESERQYGASDIEIAKYKEQFYEILTNFEFTPAGRSLANIGAPTRVVANCIVLHFDDSMEGIFNTLRDAALLQQAGSGLGFAWHLLRPAGMFASSTRGVSSGPISFLKAYNQAFGVIKQQGRHGANMGVMRVDHPDILEFIESKWNEGELVNFNLSVALTDEFMKQVKGHNPNPWLCEWKGQKMKPRRVVRNKRGAVLETIEETLTAHELMQKILAAAWRNGEPGVLFPDAANRSNPVPALGRLEATNPCGEQWLHDGDVCNLGSVNLSRFVKNGKLDEERLKYVTRMATRMLDNVIDVSNFPVEKVNNRFRDNRRVGLGIMGFADLLYQLRIGYNTPEGFKMAEYVMKIVNDTAIDESIELAKKKGVFPNWEISIFGPQGLNVRRRNAALTTVAPTGSISMILDCSSGVEPFFALAYYKEGMGGQRFPYLNKYLEAELKERGLYSEELMAKIIQIGSIQNLTEIPEDMKRIYVTAMDISAEDHIRVQAAFQKHVENSISKTINFSNSATMEDVEQGYILAWEAGCKGCTVYRDGSRQEQVIYLNKEDNKAKNTAPAVAMERTHDTLTDLKKHKICPECKSTVKMAEGCILCITCGFSACAV